METNNTEKRKFRLTKQHWQGAGAVTVIVAIVVTILALTPGVNLFDTTAPGASESAAEQGPHYTITYNSAGPGELEAYIVGEDDEGMQDAVPSGTPVAEGKMIFFNAMPADGYAISLWLINGVEAEGTGHVLILPGMTENTVVTVQFES